VKRHKDFIYATFGNMRPLIESPKGVRFQSREVILSKDGTVRVYNFDAVWDIDPARDEAMEPMVPPLRHDGPIRDVGIFDDDKLLITSSDDAVKVWDGLSCALRKSIEGQFMYPLFFSRGGLGGGRFATVDVTGQVVTLWDSKTLEPVGTIRPEGSPKLIGAGLSRDGRTLATIGEDHSVALRDAADGKPFAILRPPTPPIARVFVEANWTKKPVLQLDDPFWEGVKSLLPPVPEPAKK
jgi:WD40 repeat protein